MRVDFYYWSWQCPLNCEMIELLMEYQDRLDIHLHDISDRPGLAKQMKMYYPTLTVVEERYRFFSPLRRSFLEALCEGNIPDEAPYRPLLGTEERVFELVPITEENYELAGQCIGKKCADDCAKKIAFYKNTSLKVWGYMNLCGEALSGGAEWIPSLLVPYDVPRGDRIAFLTCIYPSNEAYDGKSAPLRALEEMIAESYDRVIVVSDEMGVFPNGDMNFFLRNGNRDLGIIAREDEYCILHLMEKRLDIKQAGCGDTCLGLA